MRLKGKIASWNDDKGFGFIAPFDGGNKVFVHIKAFRNGSRRPATNDVVTYSVARDIQERTRAVNAILAGNKSPRKSHLSAGLSANLVALLFLSAVGTSIFLDYLPLLVLGGYLLISTITFVIYAIDKSAARAGRWRTSEGTLHLLALAGGWPGALVAQQSLRHKSKKVSFRVFFGLTVLLNCAGLAWLHTLEGRTLLEQLLRAIL